MREKKSQKRKLKKLIQLPVQYLGKDEIQLVRGAPLGIQEGAKLNIFVATALAKWVFKHFPTFFSITHLCIFLKIELGGWSGVFFLSSFCLPVRWVKFFPPRKLPCAPPLLDIKWCTPYLHGLHICKTFPTLYWIENYHMI